MEEYSETVEVRRKMHVRPRATLVESMRQYLETYPELEFEIKNYEGRVAKGMGILNIFPLSMPQGEELTITARGEYDLFILEEIVGELTGFVATEIPGEKSFVDIMNEEKAKSKY